MFKTYSAKPSDIQREWHVIDATNLVVGRLASLIVHYLRGKHKATFTPHMDCGDNIIVINADKVVFTGNKMDRKDGKFYYRHTGYPGGIKETTAGKVLSSKYPERVLYMAVRRMISRNPLGRVQLKHLYLYAGENHPHSGQQPQDLPVASFNSKNVRG